MDLIIVTSSDITVSQSAPPTVSLTAPSPGTSYTQPATIYLTAEAADTDGSITQVAFYNGNTLLGVDTVTPYTYEWNSVNAGTYNITAIALDDSGATGNSALLQIAVINGIPQAYYIHTDHLNTPRLITDQANSDVWRWDNYDPFGNNAADSDPNNTGNPFVYNLRFPGQYYDQETGLHYNYFRDYSAQEGRYIQSDPIGLEGGINTYAYVEGNPLSYVDRLGLQRECVDPSGNRVACPRNVCITAECAAGLPPAVNDSRTLEEKDISQCKFICGALWMGPLVPTGRSSIIPWVSGTVSSYFVCNWICDDPDRRDCFLGGR
ncbi:MAG: RHS repeat-associated core domain-containing protein [Methylophilaceae bacterium]|nr:RHS repeat-associated core domain-containing protein [Methylophilaceae bacterium]